jgi:hypothetical protein
MFRKPCRGERGGLHGAAQVVRFPMFFLVRRKMYLLPSIISVVSGELFHLVDVVDWIMSLFRVHAWSKETRFATTKASTPMLTLLEMKTRGQVWFGTNTLL